MYLTSGKIYNQIVNGFKINDLRGDSFMNSNRKKK